MMKLTNALGKLGHATGDNKTAKKKDPPVALQTGVDAEPVSSPTVDAKPASSKSKVGKIPGLSKLNEEKKVSFSELGNKKVGKKGKKKEKKEETPKPNSGKPVASKTSTLATGESKEDVNDKGKDKDEDKPKELNQNEINEILIKIGESKQSGMNAQGLIEAVATVMKTDDGERMLEDGDNANQILFAKKVWNVADQETRPLFLKSENNWFRNLASDAAMTPILAAALDAFKNSIQGGNSEGAAAYHEIQQKYVEAKAKQAAMTAFTPQMTPGELRLIAKNESRVDRGPHEEHKSNESSCTYPFTIGRLIKALGIDYNLLTIATIKAIVLDVLFYLSIHGQKTVAALARANSLNMTAIGPISSVDIKPMIVKLLDHDWFHLSQVASAQNKYIGNEYLTLKRIVRLIHICTEHRTVWGLMHHEANFVENLTQLHELEHAIKSPDMNSLAIVWYLCIGRGNICTIMVDHYEESAANVLAELLGKDTQNAFEPAPHAFPFDKPLDEDFA